MDRPEYLTVGDCSNLADMRGAAAAGDDGSARASLPGKFAENWRDAPAGGHPCTMHRIHNDDLLGETWHWEADDDEPYAPEDVEHLHAMLAELASVLTESI
jgi:hypothetical protein